MTQTKSALLLKMLLIASFLCGTGLALFSYKETARAALKVMKRIKSILCPTTLSDDSDLAIGYAVALARIFEAELHLCYCATVSSWSGIAAAPTMAHLEVAGLFDQSLAPYLKQPDNLKWQGVVIGGSDPAEAIVRESIVRGVDLIVMCSRRRPLAAALMGSVAESVCRTAPCPVLVTHPDKRQWTATEAGNINLQKVLVAHDFSDYSELALQAGTMFAQEFHSELHLLHVLPPTRRQEPELAWTDFGKENPYHQMARRLQRSIPQESASWCAKVLTAVQEGPPYREILGYADEQAADLICLGAHGANFGANTLFGSNVDRVLRQAGCPVLVARPRRTGH